MTDFFVDPLNGSDAAAGTSFATAFKTTQKAFDTAVGGDKVFLSATATETPSATIDVDTNAGSVTAPIEFVGADSSGVELTTGLYTISGTSLPATTDLMFLSVANLFLNLKRIRITAGTRDGIATATSGSFIVQVDTCRIDTNASDGLFVPTTSGHWYVVNTEIDNNIGRGTGVNAAGRMNAEFHFCNVHDNGSFGIELGGDLEVAIVNGCILDSNGDDNLRARGLGTTITNNTSFNATGDGYSIEDPRSTLINNTASGCSGFGFNFDSTGDDFPFLRSNHTFNNTSGPSNITLTGEGNQTGDPLFADAAGGDFQPSASSPLTDNATGGGDIGAVKSASSGGGGLLTHPGMAGGMRG